MDGIFILITNFNLFSSIKVAVSVAVKVREAWMFWWWGSWSKEKVKNMISWPKINQFLYIRNTSERIPGKKTHCFWLLFELRFVVITVWKMIEGRRGGGEDVLPFSMFLVSIVLSWHEHKTTQHLDQSKHQHKHHQQHDVKKTWLVDISSLGLLLLHWKWHGMTPAQDM